MIKTKSSIEFEQLIESLTCKNKMEQDLNELTRQVRKTAIKTAVGAELADRLGYAEHDPV